MIWNKISDKAAITEIPSCPIRILDCTILHDKKNNQKYLQLEIENHSDRVLASLTLMVICRNSEGSCIAQEEHNFFTHRNFSGNQYDIQHQESAVTLPDGTVRVSVQVQQVLAYRCGDHGETLDITNG